jgi:acetyl esterase/lipase
LIDIKCALAWLKQHIAEYGGDPNFIVVTGGSAGGHLSALTALTPNDPEYQPGFEQVDTSVQGCIPFYGVYDFTGTTDEHDGQAELLEKYVMKGSPAEIPLAYDRASPLRRVGEHAPPFFVIHGDCDTLVPVAQARAFVRELRASSQEPVVYAELPGAQHVFDIFHTLRNDAVVDAAERFANTLHERCRPAIRDRETANSAAPSRPRLRVV